VLFSNQTIKNRVANIDLYKVSNFWCLYLLQSDVCASILLFWPFTRSHEPRLKLPCYQSFGLTAFSSLCSPSAPSSSYFPSLVWQKLGRRTLLGRLAGTVVFSRTRHHSAPPLKGPPVHFAADWLVGLFWLVTRVQNSCFTNYMGRWNGDQYADFAVF